MWRCRSFTPSRRYHHMSYVTPSCRVYINYYKQYHTITFAPTSRRWWYHFRQHQRKTSDTLGQRVYLELNNPSPFLSLHHSVDVCLLFHFFTEEGKHLEVIFPLGFHLFHRLPLYETMKASVSFHWKGRQNLFLSDHSFSWTEIQQISHKIQPVATKNNGVQRLVQTANGIGFGFIWFY